jgi:flagellar hook-basal body complex protein FliE
MTDLRIRSVSEATSVRPVTLPELRQGSPTFGETLGRTIADVNRLQLDAARAATEVASGQGADMTEALVTIQKADVAFQFALQIRNKLLEAYQEVMRMPV